MNFLDDFNNFFLYRAQSTIPPVRKSKRGLVPKRKWSIDKSASTIDQTDIDQIDLGNDDSNDQSDLGNNASIDMPVDSSSQTLPNLLHFPDSDIDVSLGENDIWQDVIIDTSITDEAVGAPDLDHDMDLETDSRSEDGSILREADLTNDLPFDLDEEFNSGKNSLMQIIFE